MKARTTSALPGSAPAVPELVPPPAPPSPPAPPEPVVLELVALELVGLVVGSSLQAAKTPTETNDTATRRLACRFAGVGRSLDID
jgi:hypothetical protein